MMSRTLFSIPKFFASSFKITKEGFFIPNPPLRPLNERFLLINILKQKNVENYYKQLSDPNFAPVERKEAKSQYQSLKAEYDRKKEEYENSFNYPKSGLNSYNLFIQKEMQNRGDKSIQEVIKSACQAYKLLSDLEIKNFKEQEEMDHQKFLQKQKEYEEKHAQLKIPKYKLKNKYTLFVEENSKGRHIDIKQIAESWRLLSEEEKNEYHIRANAFNQQILEGLNEFAKRLNLSEEDKQLLRKGFQSESDKKKKLEKTKSKKESNLQNQIDSHQEEEEGEDQILRQDIPHNHHQS